MWQALVAGVKGAAPRPAVGINGQPGNGVLEGQNRTFDGRQHVTCEAVKTTIQVNTTEASANQQKLMDGTPDTMTTPVSKLLEEVDVELCRWRRRC